MMKEQALLGLRRLSLHSGSIGGASEAAAVGVGRAEIMKVGGVEVEGGRLIHQAGGGGSGDQPEVGQEVAGVSGEQVTLQVKV